MSRAAATVLFDLDGTLVDTTTRIQQAWGAMCEAFGRPSPEDWTTVYASTMPPLLERLSSDPAEREAMAADYRRRYFALEHLPESAFPGVVESVTALRTRGVRTAVVTSKGRKGALRALRAVQLLGHVEVVVTAEDVVRHKPDPEPVQQALDRLAVPSGSAWFVGDMPSDLQAGRAAGVRTAAAAWSTCPRARLEECAPDRWLMEPAEILGLV